MSEKLLLTDKNRCPQCFVRRNGDFDGNCHNCGTRLFPSILFDFQKYEDDGNVRHWWAFTKESGWKHRDHFMVATAKPQDKYQKPVELEKSYGRSTTPAEVAARGGKLELNVKA
jgi:hypothetical protein